MSGMVFLVSGVRKKEKAPQSNALKVADHVGAERGRFPTFIGLAVYPKGPLSYNSTFVAQSGSGLRLMLVEQIRPRLSFAACERP
jgi:hypothetical protein